MMRGGLLVSSTVKSRFVQALLLMPLFLFGTDYEKEKDTTLHQEVISGISHIYVADGAVVYNGSATVRSKISHASENTKQPKSSTGKNFRKNQKESRSLEKERQDAHAYVNITSGSDSALENLIRKSCTQCVLSNTNPAVKVFLKKTYVFRFSEQNVQKTIFNKDLNSIRLSGFSGEAFSIRPPPILL